MDKKDFRTASDISDIDVSRHFFYENAFYLTSPPSRIRKLLVHYELFRRTADLSGDIVECGVFKGVSLSRFIKFRDIFRKTSEKKVIGFDVFGEFPMPDGECAEGDTAGRENFIKDAGEHSISEEQLMEFLKGSESSHNVELVKGDVLVTLPEYLEKNPELEISLLNVDIDLYKPTFACLCHLYDRIVKHGIIILDDYKGFPGATKAIDEFFADKRGIKIENLGWAASSFYVIKK